MKAYAITPEAGPVEIGLDIYRNDTNDWEISVEGDIPENVQNSAEHAVFSIRDELHEQSNSLQEYINQDKKRTLNFNLDAENFSNGNLGSGFAARMAVQKIYDYIEQIAGEKIVPDYNLAVMGKVGRSKGVGEAIPITAAGISRSNIDATLEILGKGGLLLFAQDENIEGNDMISSCRKRGVRCEVVKTLPDIVRELLKDGARTCFEKAIRPLSLEIDSCLDEFLEFETENEKFKEYYMREVVLTFNRFQDLQQRYSYYEERLKAMESAKAGGKPVTNICDDIKKALKDGNPFTVDIDVAEAGDDDDGDQHKSPGPSSDHSDDLDDKISKRDSAIISNLKRRWNEVVIKSTHPDHNPDKKDNPEEFRIAKEVAENQDTLLIQMLILKYWPDYIQRRKEEKNIKPIDDMENFDSTIQFFREAQQVRALFDKRKEARKEDELTKERQVWEEAKEKDKDTVQEEKDLLIARSKQKEREIQNTVRKVRKLCNEARRPID